MVRYVRIAAALVAFAGSPASVAAQPPVFAPPRLNQPAPADGRVALDIEGLRFFVEFVNRGEAAELRLSTGDGLQSMTLPLADYQMALAILADRRLEGLWRPLLAWAGPDLGSMRARAVEAARAANDAATSPGPPRASTTAEVSPERRARLEYALALRHNGRVAEAIAILRSELAATRGRSGQDRLDRSIFAVSLASSLRMSGDLEGALRVLSEGEAALAGTPFALNLRVNRAAYLAEGGRYSEALSVIEGAARSFRPEGSRAVVGSDRHFAWIRACALHGLGRTAEARSLFATIERDTIVNRGFRVVQSGQSIRMRALNCMRDSEGLVDELLAGFVHRPIAPWLFVLLQPGFRSASWNADVLAEVRSDPRMQAAVRGLIRTLPPQLEPALRN